jgi:hypothetical protein
MADVDAKFKLEDILNKQKAPPQILDLVHITIETEEGYKKYIHKIPDYKIRPERVSFIWRANNNLILLTIPSQNVLLKDRAELSSFDNF